MKKAVSLTLALIVAASSVLFTMPFATAAEMGATWSGIRTSLSPARQRAYQSQINIAFRAFAYRISNMGTADAIRTLDLLDSKIATLQSRPLSEKNRFVLAYVRYLSGVERVAVMNRPATYYVPAAPVLPATPQGSAYDNTDVVTRAAVTVSPQNPPGKVVVPFQEEEIGSFAVYAIGDVLTLTDFYVSNVGTAVLDQHLLSVSLYDGSGSKLSDGSLVWPDTIRFGTSLAIPKNTVATLSVRALFRNPNDGGSLGKTVALQLGVFSWIPITDGTILGVRLVAKATGQTVPTTTAGSVVASTHLLARTKLSVSSIGTPSSQTNSFSLATQGDGTTFLTRLYVDVNLRPSLDVTGWILYKNRESADNIIAGGTGPVPLGSGANPLPIVLSRALDLAPGTTTDFVLSIRTSGTPVADGKRTFRIMDAEYQNVSPSGSSVMISGLNRFPGTGFPTVEVTYSY